MLRPRRWPLPALAVVAASAAVVVPAFSASATTTTTTCAKLASPTGSDGNSGSVTSPYRTVQKLVNNLKPGQTGCLAGGATFAQDVTVSTAGTSDLPIVLTTRPGGAPATLRGRLWLKSSSHDWTIAGLNLDGRNVSGATNPSPTINGSRITFRRDDVTNYHTGICFNIGSDPWTSYGTASGVVLDSNRIHDCGRIPATNHDHGIYVDSSRNATITNNVIYNNADRGIQLYPDATGTVITHNTIDGNGEGVLFSGANGYASNGTVVRGNVVTYSRIRANVESWWPLGNPIGTDNVVTGNCVYAGAQGNIGDQVGFSAYGNTVADPLFVNRSGGDYRLSSGSGCTGMGATG